MSDVHYRIDAEGRYWLTEEQLLRLEAEREQSRAEVQAERDAEIAAQMREIEAEAEAEAELARKPLSQERIDDLAQLRVNDLIEYDTEVEDLGERLANSIPVPPADELGVDIAGLPPARAALTVYVEHLRQVEAEAKKLEDAKARYLADLGVPDQTEREIDELVKGDRSNVLRRLLSKGTIDATDIRTAHRQQLEDRLPQEKHARAVAQGVLGTLEVQADVISKRVMFMKRKLEGFVNDAILEWAGAEFAAEYIRRVKALEEIVGSLLGLGRVARVSAASSDVSSFFRSVGTTFHAQLPRFQLAGLPEAGMAIACDDKLVEAAAEPWLALAHFWTQTPLADPPASLMGGSG